MGTSFEGSHRGARRGARRIETQQLKATVRGRVQGVSFRYATQRRAIELGVKGWVRNAQDGSVELIAEGSRGTLEQFLEFLHQGPRFAQVEAVEVSWQEASGEFQRFQIVS